MEGILNILKKNGVLKFLERVFCPGNFSGSWIDVQMILLSFFDILNKKYTKQEKTNFFWSIYLISSLIWTAGRINQEDKISFSLSLYFWLGSSKNDNNMISTSRRINKISKLQGCGFNTEPATPILSSKLKRACKA